MRAGASLAAARGERRLTLMPPAAAQSTPPATSVPSSVASPRRRAWRRATGALLLAWTLGTLVLAAVAVTASLTATPG